VKHRSRIKNVKGKLNGEDKGYGGQKSDAGTDIELCIF
jgi:hypothetical protein